MKFTTSLQLSKLLQEKGATVEPSFWWAFSGIKRGDREVVYADIGDDTSPDDVPAYLLSDLPAVLEGIGEKLQWTEAYCAIRGDKKPHARDSSCAVRWASQCEEIHHFLRFCEIFSRGYNEESWAKAEEYLIGILK